MSRRPTCFYINMLWLALLVPVPYISLQAHGLFINNVLGSRRLSTVYLTFWYHWGCGIHLTLGLFRSAPDLRFLVWLLVSLVVSSVGYLGSLFVEGVVIDHWDIVVGGECSSAVLFCMSPVSVLLGSMNSVISISFDLTNL